MAKSYREFDKATIGESESATLLMCGPLQSGEASAVKLCFREDSLYSAYIVTGFDVDVGAHYSLVAVFKSWLRIYDDFGISFKAEADQIEVYRAGDFGCVIKLVGGSSRYASF